MYMTEHIRVLIIDDSPHFLEAASAFLQLERTFKVVGTAANAEEAVTRSGQLQPDIILLDLQLSKSSGLSLIPILKENLPYTRIIVLSMMEDTAFRPAALEAGADDFVSKQSMSRMLVPALHRQIQRSAYGQTYGRHDTSA